MCVCWFWRSYTTTARCSPGALQKIPTPRLELAVACCTVVLVQSTQGASHRQQTTQVTGDKARHSGGHSLARARTSDDQRRPFCHHEQARGCGPSGPVPSQWAAVPTRRDDAICHMSSLSAESPLQSQPYIPTLWIGRSLDVLFQATREDLIPWIGFALRGRETLGLFFSFSHSLFAQLSSAPLFFFYFSF